MLFLLVVCMLVLVACDSGGSNAGEPDFQTTWQQSFDADTENWITQKISGPNGWCGDIAHVGTKEGSVAPSAGAGYATVAHGECNAFYAQNGFANGSGPYGRFGEYKYDGTNDGFITELDIYLDPSWSASGSNIFTYAVSFELLNRESSENLRYFFIPVTKENDAIVVAGREIDEPGWYTFQHRFRGRSPVTDFVDTPRRQLVVEFTLLQDGQTLARKDLFTTALARDATSSLDLRTVGSGTAWFVSIDPGLRVPIDEQRLLQ